LHDHHYRALQRKSQGDDILRSNHLTKDIRATSGNEIDADPGFRLAHQGYACYLMPDGQIARAAELGRIQPSSQKYSDFPNTQIGLYVRRPVPLRGALRNVINAGRDAVDADGASDEGA
jgi:hypothetical protein